MRSQYLLQTYLRNLTEPEGCPQDRLTELIDRLVRLHGAEERVRPGLGQGPDQRRPDLRAVIRLSISLRVLRSELTRSARTEGVRGPC